MVVPIHKESKIHFSVMKTYWFFFHLYLIWSWEFKRIFNGTNLLPFIFFLRNKSRFFKQVFFNNSPKEFQRQEKRMRGRIKKKSKWKKRGLHEHQRAAAKRAQIMSSAAVYISLVNSVGKIIPQWQAILTPESLNKSVFWIYHSLHRVLEAHRSIPDESHTHTYPRTTPFSK